MKRLRGLFIILLILLSMLPVLVCGAETSYTSGSFRPDVHWSLNEETGELIITGTNGIWKQNYCEYPWYLYWEKVTSLKVGEGITHIPQYAFRGFSSLEYVELPQSVEFIGEGAFQDCSALIRIKMPNHMDTIGKEAFRGCTSLQEFWVPNGLLAVSERTFYGCESLREVTLPHNLRTVGSYAFSGCGALEKIQFPWSVTTIGPGAFRDCVSLQEAILPEKLEFLSEYTFENCTALTGITLPEWLDSVGDNAFRGCTALEEVELPRGLQRIGAAAFRDCASLQELSLPQGMVYIGSEAFYGCESLRTLSFPRWIRDIYGETCYGCTSLELVVLPEKLEYIGYSAFQNCKNLRRVENLNESVQLMADAFGNSPIGVQLWWKNFRDSGAALVVAVVLIGALLLWMQWYRMKGSKGRFWLRVCKASTLGFAMLAVAVLVDGMDLPLVTRAFGSPLMWLPSLLPPPWNLIVIDYLEYVFQGFCCIVVVFGIAVHQWFCTGEALRSSGKLPCGSRVARLGVLAGSFGALALWCYLTWRGRQEGWASYEELSVIFPVGILCGLAAVLLPGWKWGREMIVKKRGIAFAGAGLVGCLWLLAPIPGILEKYSIFIMEVWRMGLLVLAVACGAIAVYFLACAVYNGWKYRDREESTVDWGRIARVGIIVAAVVIGYMIFCVLARGNFESEYFAEQITVTHVYEDSEERTVYCVDFVREELQFYTQDADGNRELHWTKPLTTEALDEFVETCNREGLLSLVERSVGEKRSYDYDFVYVTTYSARGERVVYSSTLYSGKKLNQAFYDLTGIYCLDMP